MSSQDSINNDNTPKYSRWPDEPELAWAAFLLYRDMERPRLFQKLLDQLPKLSENTLRDYSIKWDWRTRIEEYDLMRDNARINTRTITIADMVEVWSKERDANILNLKKDLYASSQRMLQMATMMLSEPLYVNQYDKRGNSMLTPLLDDEGNPVVDTGGNQIMRPIMVRNGWSLKDAPLIAKAGMEMSAWSLDLPQTVSESRISLQNNWEIDLGEVPVQIDSPMIIDVLPAEIKEKEADK